MAEPVRHREKPRCGIASGQSLRSARRKVTSSSRSQRNSRCVLGSCVVVTCFVVSLPVTSHAVNQAQPVTASHSPEAPLGGRRHEADAEAATAGAEDGHGGEDEAPPATQLSAAALEGLSDSLLQDPALGRLLASVSKPKPKPKPVGTGTGGGESGGDCEGDGSS